MAKYQQYAKYKDSGVEWLGEVPEHWGLPKLIHQTSRIGDGLHSTPQYQDKTGYYFINGNNLVDGYIVVGETSKEVPEEEYKKHYIHLDKSSVLLSINGTIGNVARYNNERVILGKSAAYMNCSDDLLPEYLMLYLQSSQALYYFNLEVTGTTIFNLSLNSIRQMKVCLPAKQEQTQIANFLDHETAKIDTLIEKQKTLIQLLKEKRQAVISHAVTKGLNPDAPMKDSGVEWLGAVPAHWEVKRFKTIFKIRKRIAGELGHDVLSITQKGIKVKDIESGEGQLSMDYSKYQLVSKGDYAMNHMDLLTGFVDISKYDGVTSPDYRVFTLEEANSVPEYFLAFLQMGYINKLFFPFGQGAAHIGRWRLPTEAFKEFLAPVPPENEQQVIADFIFNSLEQMDILEKKSRKAISLMQERRTALISAAVTGKIDVRGWVAPE
ncbi:restriction endonuclease subunit S [Psychrobacter sp. BF1]|uniref:restriction endonuclease subunit S n=1 Tax=Psychrobacter sp. BF1 TaxID=2821147 RepID=UPI001C4DF3B6|nr:restriction endonuclease subunit S [Psychrobacter sp. BF1]